MYETAASRFGYIRRLVTFRLTSIDDAARAALVN
jgi:hypothetical protein